MPVRHQYGCLVLFWQQVGTGGKGHCHNCTIVGCGCSAKVEARCEFGVFAVADSCGQCLYLQCFTLTTVFLLSAAALQRSGEVGSQYGVTVDTVGITDAALAQAVMETFNDISYIINSQDVGAALPNTVAAVAAATNSTALTIASERGLPDLPGFEHNCGGCRMKFQAPTCEVAVIELQYPHQDGNLPQALAHRAVSPLKRVIAFVLSISVSGWAFRAS